MSIYFTDMLLIPSGDIESPDLSELKNALAGSGMIHCAQVEELGNDEVPNIVIDFQSLVTESDYREVQMREVQDLMNNCKYDIGDEHIIIQYTEVNLTEEEDSDIVTTTMECFESDDSDFKWDAILINDNYNDKVVLTWVPVESEFEGSDDRHEFDWEVGDRGRF